MYQQGDNSQRVDMGNAFADSLGVMVYFARQYQSIESNTRAEGLLSQDMGINLTLYWP